MHTVANVADAQVLGVDDDTIRTAVIAVLSTAGGQKAIGMLLDRRRGRVDAATAMAQAASVIASAAAEAVKPQAEALEQLRAQQAEALERLRTFHAEDLREIRAGHAAAMERMAIKIGEVEAQYAEVRRRNDDLVTEIVRLGGVASRP